MKYGEVDIGEDTYNGKPMISLTWAEDDRYPFSFGVMKAKMLVSALEQNPNFLERFIAEKGSKR